jgi:predicted TIM-barrel fold metal-dependent hydrolase
MEAKMSKPANVKNIIDHLGDVEYPVTGKAFMEACNNMSDVSKEQREWVKNNINMEKTYRSPEEIKMDLKL